MEVLVGVRCLKRHWAERSEDKLKRWSITGAPDDLFFVGVSALSMPLFLKLSPSFS